MTLLVSLAMAKGNSRPFVALACFCENALQEPDQVVSLIRVIDTVYVEIPTDLPLGVEPAIEQWCVISLKGGDVVGTFEKLKVRITTPNGETKDIGGPFSTTFTGGASGMNLRIKVVLKIKKFGLGWVDVLWDDEVLTSIPIDVKPLSEAPAKA